MSTPLIEELSAECGPELMTLTVDQYEQMLSTGILSEDSPVELIDGLLVQKDRSTTEGSAMPHAPRHAMTVARISRALDRISEPLGMHARAQLPLILDGRNAPEPDVALVAGPIEAFSERHPGPGDVHLLVEVSDSSLRYDRTTKQRLYATAGIPLYWIVNLANDSIEVFRSPDSRAGVYRESFTIARDGTLSLSLAGRTHELPASSLL